MESTTTAHLFKPLRRDGRETRGPSSLTDGGHDPLRQVELPEFVAEPCGEHAYP